MSRICCTCTSAAFSDSSDFEMSTHHGAMMACSWSRAQSGLKPFSMASGASTSAVTASIVSCGTFASAAPTAYAAAAFPAMSPWMDVKFEVKPTPTGYAEPVTAQPLMPSPATHRPGMPVAPSRSSKPHHTPDEKWEHMPTAAP